MVMIADSSARPDDGRITRQIGRVEIGLMIIENGLMQLMSRCEDSSQCHDIVVCAVCPWVPGLASFITPRRDRSCGKVFQLGSTDPMTVLATRSVTPKFPGNYAPNAHQFS